MVHRRMLCCIEREHNCYNGSSGKDHDASTETHFDAEDGEDTVGNAFDGIQFRKAILSTVPVVDAQARLVLPRLPVLRPHVRMAHHLRILTALFPTDNSCLKIYDLAVQKARYSETEPTETEFESGMRAYHDIIDILSEYKDDTTNTNVVSA
ncbi:hypothetical protein Clacol_002983 [Clathrus columnatus]|uniref:Uncharacterized protein n=1 Tax=Clathrus columnatus TaxID=1419009 RepID=A0AAV5A694_9AGAM|nr:hypothetical protein Clacol_002983 [Clathrus columnatus]